MPHSYYLAFEIPTGGDDRIRGGRIIILDGPLTTAAAVTTAQRAILRALLAGRVPVPLGVAPADVMILNQIHLTDQP